MTLPADPAERHRAVTASFTTRVLGASDWDAPAPVAGWRARDVVSHLVEWFPDFLNSATGLVLDRGPSTEDDPVAAWQVHADAVQRLLDGPEAAAPGPAGSVSPSCGSCRTAQRHPDMSESLKDDVGSADEPETSSRQPSEGPSGLRNVESSAGGADAVPDTPDNVPADGAE